MQYRTGTAAPTNGSATVNITGASTGADSVAAGDAFKVDRDNETVYSISARTPSSGPSITSLTISPAYGGTTGSGLNYQITQDFTTNRGYPEFAQGDQDAADWLTKALRMLDTDMGLLLGSGGALTITNNQVVFWNSGLKGSANLTWTGTSFAIGTAGPHAIGGAVNVGYQLVLKGSFTSGATSVFGFVQDATNILTPAVNGDAWGMSISPRLVKAGSGTHADFGSVILTQPTIDAGAATLTNASTLKIVGAPTGATNNYTLWSTGGSVRLDGVGPHSIGGALFTGTGLYLTGTFAGGGGVTRGMQLDRTLTPAANIDAVGLYCNPSFTEAASGTHADFVGAYFTVQAITGGAAALTNASTVKIGGAPTGASNNYALWVAGGHSRFGGALAAQGGNYASGGASGPSAHIGYDSAITEAYLTGANFGSGFIDLRISAQTLRLYYGGTPTLGVLLTSAGILALGTTVTTGSAAGDMVFPNNTAGVRAVTFAGSGTLSALFVNASDQVVLGAGAADIKWGKALVALGGGSTATLGTIGGSGPATAAQDSWVRLIDSTGVAKWVPAWD